MGGARGILILIVTGLVGIIAILAVWLFRQNMTAPPVGVIEASPGEVLRLGRNARGNLPEVPYLSNDLARVFSYAAVQRSDGVWNGLEAGTILKVAGTTVDRQGLWVSGTMQDNIGQGVLKIHSSFLERYTP